ncbi:hypothetical protein CHS0354_005712 [Potamilus streckersoni]|uniref:LSM domain-containing protein n=1 Tax=Potamilus streckersoni TaxID=2493646 RepID=A0AAE0VJL7_9BIVA|nr:hypothetical protein CHS0354_005712 [Potamilus streckersoni]
MAAPIKKSPSSYSSTKSSEELDLTSPKFNPLKSLYAAHVNIPCPEAKLYNNIAQYESFMKGKDAESQKQKRPSKPHHPGLIAYKAAAQAREAVMKSRSEDGSKNDNRRKRMQRSTIFTLMEKHGASKGPLSLLFRCVRDKLQILVVVRGAVSVRGYCKGYLIAYDKHFNMALLDVDESYLKPVKGPKINSQESVEDEVDYPDKSCIDKTDISSSHQRKIKQEVVMGIMEELQCRFTDTSVSTLQNIPRDATVDSMDFGRSERVKYSKSQGVSQSLDVANNEIKFTVKSEPEGNVLPAQCLRMESYKQLAESRSYAKFDIIRRHVNQLLIRGENVVSVSIAN